MPRVVQGPVFRRARGLLCRLAVHAPALVRLLPTREPVPFERHLHQNVDGHRDLLLLLPGIADTPVEFVRWGFIDALHRSGWPVDVVAADAHYGYYARETVLERLRQDVIQPARSEYRQVWVGGISLGGFGALYYAARYTEDVAGVIALAPFLGRPPLIDQIHRAGGLRRWHPTHAGNDHVERLWTWLQQHTESASHRPALYLAYGAQDRFSPAHRLLAEVLPADRVFVVPGGHTWSTWVQLWPRVVQKVKCEA